MTAPNGLLTLDVSDVPVGIYEGHDVTFAFGTVTDRDGHSVDIIPNYELFYDDYTGKDNLITWDEDPENPKTGTITIPADQIVEGRVFRLNYNVFMRGYAPVLGGMDIRVYAEPTVTLSVDRKTAVYGETVTFTVNAPGATSAWVEDPNGQRLNGFTWTADRIGTFGFSAKAAFEGFGTVEAARPVSMTVRSKGPAPAPTVDAPETVNDGESFSVIVTPAEGGWITVRIHNNGTEPTAYVEHAETKQTLTIQDAQSGMYWVEVDYGKDGYDDGERICEVIHAELVYGAPEWWWGDDYSAAHATFTSTRWDVIKYSEAGITSAVTTEPTCGTTGVRTYTATAIFQGQEYTDTREETLQKIPHRWGTPEFAWTATEDGYSATATFTCGSCGDVSIVENVTVTRIRHTDATCTKQEVSVYRAECGDYSEDKTVYGDALGHAWGDWSIVWNDDYTAYATHRCDRCGQTGNADVTVTHEDTKAASCQTKGEITYTASATLDGQEVTSTKKQYTPKTGHTPGRTETSEDGHFKYTYCSVCGELLSAEFAGHRWGEPEYTWADDCSTVTAIHTCSLTPDLPHSEWETVEAELTEITKEPTCEETGLGTYISKPFINEAFTVQTYENGPVAALGHDWGEPEYEWLYGNTRVRATRTCTRNAEHTDTEEVGVTVVSYKAPTETKAGKAVYTSEAFTMDGCTVQTRTVTIPALNKMPTMTLPSGLTVIEKEAFSNLGCEAIIVPAGCTKIEEYAFAGCKNLKYIRIPAKLMGQVPENAFEGCNADLVIEWK